jgi:hypothetical protein
VARQHVSGTGLGGRAAIYFALVLSAAGEETAARELWKAAEGVELLPEERELVGSKRPMGSVSGVGDGG